VDVSVRDRVEADVDGACRGDDRSEMLFDGTFVERIDYSDVRDGAIVRDFGGNRLKTFLLSAGKEDARSLGGEGARYGTPDDSAASIDNGDLVLEKHLVPPALC
jgi:hypothetical protein